MLLRQAAKALYQFKSGVQATTPALILAFLWGKTVRSSRVLTLSLLKILLEGGT
jgi:hypothetical protein